MGEKTEKASPKKLRDARKKGQVAKSQDLPAAFTFIASVALILALSTFLYNQLAGFIVAAFTSVTNPETDTAIVALFYKAAEVIFIASIPALGLVTLIGLLINYLAIGPVFSTEAMKFDWKKLNPVDNLKAKFKLKTLVELLKSVAKIGIAGYIIYLVMLKSIPVLITTVSLPILGSLLVFHAFLIEVVVKVGIFFLIIAVADFVYQKKSFATEMKMEKFEVKQEYKNTEGDPQIKGKRRQIAQEIAYQEGPTFGVKKAQALVTNPKHIAIAIGYRKDIDQAPYILALGKDNLAELMIKVAEQNNIPVLRNVPLAHTLWEHGELYNYVPEETYEALAEILRWIASLDEEEVSLEL
ncbi:MAG: type III secretion system export apparatus subunit SctU [Parachlamydiaceae bacterium]|nr:type III secretion system export apparatus subunit SctU [Parachlamydiaceae bacterium]